MKIIDQSKFIKYSDLAKFTRRQKLNVLSRTALLKIETLIGIDVLVKTEIINAWGNTQTVKCISLENIQKAIFKLESLKKEEFENIKKLINFREIIVTYYSFKTEFVEEVKASNISFIDVVEEYQNINNLDGKSILNFEKFVNFADKNNYQLDKHEFFEYCLKKPVA